MTSPTTGNWYGDIWLSGIPQKLGGRMADEPEILPEGWGVHIIQGLDRSRLSWFVFTFVMIFVLVKLVIR
jgi:hypothetical protein